MASFARISRSVLEPASALWRLHPHQQVYFNLASGGLRTAVQNYETEYYGSVYRDLNASLVEEVWRQRRAEYLRMYGNICYESRENYLNFPWSSEAN